MSAPNYTDIETWIFDLDNTLYPPSARLFDQIEARMTAWIMRELGFDQPGANTLRAQYWKEHGTTLSGLMHEHKIDPWDFLLDVHAIDFSVLAKNPLLKQALLSLPGRKIIYTNGDAPYARNVLGGLGLTDVFDDIYGIEHSAFIPKPNTQAFTEIQQLDGYIPAKSIMFEDDARNLEAPHALGMRTVLVTPEPKQAQHIHHHTSDLAGFLSHLLAMQEFEPTS